MDEFKLSDFFPDKDIQKLKELAKEGIMLYPLLISLNSEDVKYAVAVLKSYKIKAGVIISRELKKEDPAYGYDLFVEYLMDNNINLLTQDELLSVHNYRLLTQIKGYSEAEDSKYIDYDLCGYLSLKDENRKDRNPIPVSILLYIRYIQQDGKI